MIKITYQYNSLARHSIPGLISKRFISKILIADKEYQTDSSFNIPDSIITKISTQLHTIPNHPLSLLNKKIHSFFTKNYSNEFTFIDNLTNPVVTKYQNFDSLLFPTNHPGKAVSDTYYINENELLRTHTSAHQHQTLSNGLKSFLLTAAVYRRDQIDASHYPIFHQMEGVRLFKDKKDLQLRMTTERQSISDTREANKSETLDIAMNPIQSCHLKNEDIIADLSVDLRRCLENLFVYLFANHKDLKFRWIQGSFPFTSPSWELEVWFKNEWLELCGCGIIQQQILTSANASEFGWAFGLGLERIAMFMHSIPDIRLFWTKDPRFIEQFKILESGENVVEYKSFSKYPGCYKDVSFWGHNFTDNDMNDLVRDVANDLVESVKLIDIFEHEHGISRCYRIMYRSMDRNLMNAEVNVLQETVRNRLVSKYKVNLR